MATATSRPKSNGQPESADWTGRLPPQSIEAERSVIGSMLLSASAIDEATGVLAAEDFYVHAHQRLFTAILAIHAKNKPVDPVTLAEWLAKKKQLDELGGIAYLHTIIETVPHAAHVVHYADIVKDNAHRRRLIEAGTLAVREAYDSSREPGEIAADVENGIHAIIERVAGAPATGMGILDVVLKTLSTIGEEKQWGVQSGYQGLDAILRGFKPGNLIVVAGLTSTGKTALVCGNIARNVASRGEAVFIASLEQTSMEIAERLISIESRINANALRNNDLTLEEREMLLEGARRVGEWPMFIDEGRGQTVSQIGGKLRLLMRKEPIKLAIVDYLQIIEPEDSRVNREQQISTVTRKLFMLAGQLQIPIIALAQLNRDADKRDGRPRLSDLRESGAVSQHADVVLLIDRPLTEDGDRKPWDATVIVAKQRNGPLGDVKMNYRGPTLTFVEAAEAEKENQPQVDQWWDGNQNV